MSIKRIIRLRSFMKIKLHYMGLIFKHMKRIRGWVRTVEGLRREARQLNSFDFQMT